MEEHEKDIDKDRADGIEVTTKSTNNLPPRVQDFWLIQNRRKLAAASFLDFMDKEVLGNYEPCGDQKKGCEFGIVAMEHEGMILAKLDAGPWPWYDAASEAIVQGIVQNLGAYVFVCGWALDKNWSWCERWRAHPKTGRPRMTKTVDGPSGLGVTIQAKELWRIDPRAAYDALVKATTWENVRRWLLLPEPRPREAYASFMAGKRVISADEAKTLPEAWEKVFPGRGPADGPLHVNRFYLNPQIKKKLEEEAQKSPEERRRAMSFRQEPPFTPV